MKEDNTHRAQWYALHEVVQSLDRSEFAEEDLSRVLEIATTATAADSGYLFALDSTESVLNCLASFGAKESVVKAARRLPVDDRSITGYAFRTLQSYMISDAMTAPNYFEVDRAVRSEVAVPVSAGGRILGVLSINSQEVNHFNHEDVDFLNTVASVVGLYLEKYASKDIPPSPESPEDLAREKKEFAFVLMPFREPFNKYYRSIIKPAVQKTGLVSIRADEIYRPSEIIKDIHEYITRAKLILAELTGKNPNVMYELGYSHAVGKTAVLITQTMDDVPFDLRGLRCITYDTTEPEWADLLKNTIVDFINGVKP